MLVRECLRYKPNLGFEGNISVILTLKVALRECIIGLLIV